MEVGSRAVEPRHFHKRFLDIAAEENPNNARVPTSPSKGYLECLAAGWIIEQTHPHAGYRYFTLTPAGQEARIMRAPKKRRRTSNLKLVPARLHEAPDRLGR